MADEKDVKKKNTKSVKILMRHPSHEFVPGEVVELDEKLAKSLVSQGAADDHPEAVDNPTIVRDDAGNVRDLELEKQIAAEKAKAEKNKKK